MRIKLENNHVLIAMPDLEEALELHPLGSGLMCLPKKQFIALCICLNPPLDSELHEVLMGLVHQ